MDKDSARAGDSAEQLSSLIFSNTFLQRNPLSNFAFSEHVGVASIKA